MFALTSVNPLVLMVRQGKTLYWIKANGCKYACCVTSPAITICMLMVCWDQHHVWMYYSMFTLQSKTTSQHLPMESPKHNKQVAATFVPFCQTIQLSLLTTSLSSFCQTNSHNHLSTSPRIFAQLRGPQLGERDSAHTA